jgi:hypothetical protein
VAILVLVEPSRIVSLSTNHISTQISSNLVPAIARVDVTRSNLLPMSPIHAIRSVSWQPAI